MSMEAIIRRPTRFTAEQIEAMRKAWFERQTMRSIAKQYGCSTSYVSMLLSGKRGKHPKEG